MSTIPSTMKAVVCTTEGGPEVLEYRTDVPVPQPTAGQVLVKNTTIGINYIDTYFRSGIYPSKKPEILGRDAEGEIVALGDGGETYGLKTGDRVVFLGTGSYAEYTSVPALHVAKIPAGVPATIACAALLQGLTALTLIRESHEARSGEWYLVHAAAGGVGLWLVQLLKALGARVIGTASTEAKIAQAKAAGAEVMLNYSQAGFDLVGAVMEATGGQGVDAVFDGVGKDTFEDDLKIVRRKGTVVSFGNASGTVPPFAITYVPPPHPLSLLLCTLTLTPSQKTRSEMPQTRPTPIIRLHRDPPRIRTIRDGTVRVDRARESGCIGAWDVCVGGCADGP